MSIYRTQGSPVYGKFYYKAPGEGLLQVGGPHSTEMVWSDDFEIAWTKMGNKGPLVLFLHGVPTNRTQWEEVQGKLSPFCETISIDMLGMGESSKPRIYGRRQNQEPNDLWYWPHDTDYIEKLMQQEYPGRKFIFVADDWGSGIASHYAAKYKESMASLCLL
ncbi:MAG: alpha/beta hydrolase [Nitrosospira sp.]